MDHSLFVIATADFGDNSAVAGGAFGRIHDDVPLPLEGTASYDGAMVGRDVVSATHYAGTAHLEVDFAAASLDATFSNITAIDSGETLADIRFAQGRVLPDLHTAIAYSLPGAEGTDTYLNARFYGPDHEELTGVFGKDTLIGVGPASGRSVGSRDPRSARAPTPRPRPSGRMAGPNHITKGVERGCFRRHDRRAFSGRAPFRRDHMARAGASWGRPLEPGLAVDLGQRRRGLLPCRPFAKR